MCSCVTSCLPSILRDVAYIYFKFHGSKTNMYGTKHSVGQGICSLFFFFF